MFVSRFSFKVHVLFSPRFCVSLKKVQVRILYQEAGLSPTLEVLVTPITFVPLLTGMSCRHLMSRLQCLQLGDIDDYFSPPAVCRVPSKTMNASRQE